MIIKCKECGGDVSDKAETCPHCGYSMKSNPKTDDRLKINPKSDWTPSPTVQPNIQKHKKEKKKHGCLWTIVVVLIVFGFFSWLTDDDTESGKKDSGTGTTTSQEETSTKNKTPKKTEYNLGEIYKGHKCTLKLVSGNDDGFSVDIENNSSKDFGFDIHSMSINGIMTNCNIYTGDTEVPSGKKGTMEIDFENGWISNGEKVQYIDMIVWAYDESKNYKDFETEKIRIKTNNFHGENKYSSGNGSVKKKGIVVQKESITEDKFVFSVINKNNYYVEFDFTNASIDGWALETDYIFDSQDVCVYPGAKTTVKVDISDLTEKKNINNPKNVEFSLECRKKGDYFKKFMVKKLKF